MESDNFDRSWIGREYAVSREIYVYDYYGAEIERLQRGDTFRVVGQGPSINYDCGIEATVSVVFGRYRSRGLIVLPDLAAAQ